MNARALPLLMIAATWALGCAGSDELSKLDPFPPPAPPPVPAAPEPAAAPPPARAEGSLWRGDESRRFLAFENRAKRVGDLLTVLIVEKASAENQAKTELDRDTQMDATLNSDLALQTIVSRPIIRILQFLGFTEQRTDSQPTSSLSIVDADTTVTYDGEGKTSREASFETRLACIVTGVSDSGLLQVEGERHLEINGETQIIRLAGWVRPEDVRIDNTVPSSLVASAQIKYGGVGQISEEQKAPWLLRILQKVLPF